MKHQESDKLQPKNRIPYLLTADAFPMLMETLPSSQTLPTTAGLYDSEKLDPDPHQRQNLGASEAQKKPLKLTNEAVRLKIEHWRVYRPVDKDPFDEEQDPDPDPH